MFGLFVSSIWKVLAASLVIGAGLPALFAFGVRAMAFGAGGDAEVEDAPGHPIGRVVGLLCFAVVLLAVALGITVIVAAGFGKSVSFEHVIPTFVGKG